MYVAPERIARRCGTLHGAVVVRLQRSVSRGAVLVLASAAMGSPTNSLSAQFNTAFGFTHDSFVRAKLKRVKISPTTTMATAVSDNLRLTTFWCGVSTVDTRRLKSTEAFKGMSCEDHSWQKSRFSLSTWENKVVDRT